MQVNFHLCLHPSQTLQHYELSRQILVIAKFKPLDLRQGFYLIPAILSCHIFASSILFLYRSIFIHTFQNQACQKTHQIISASELLRYENSEFLLYVKKYSVKSAQSDVKSSYVVSMQCKHTYQKEEIMRQFKFCVHLEN